MNNDKEYIYNIDLAKNLAICASKSLVVKNFRGDRFYCIEVEPKSKCDGCCFIDNDYCNKVICVSRKDEYYIFKKQ